MGHAVGTKVERAYRRTDVMELRLGLMNACALYCSPAEGGKVVSIRRKA
jgi:hypothetical protein